MSSTHHPHSTFFHKKEKWESWRDLHFIMENLKNRQTNRQLIRKEKWGRRIEVPY